eukprot:gnl/TRDRNA2_/TRDRNA2_172030_c9_seq1.p1 gnl/TRDRNA2_/TRDRNA2_172030_c9~~gnl/TRDRNA2_/TRDRNA2_172030_c9_seq1.p1  ORF type:complete len:235 (+),score=55.50 gnl/TRDRNA2_/TRDRNA2_172030_c9_seq1:52-705(+)
MDMFGTVEAALFTLYRINTSGSYWGDEFKLIHMTGIGYTSFYIFYVGFFQFAVFNILTGLFVEQAMKAGQPDRDTLIFEQRRQDMKDIEQMKHFWHKMDDDKSGTISLEELHYSLQNEKVKAYLELQGLDIQDAELFFKMISSDSGGEVDIDFFAETCLKMKGAANAMDLQELMFETKAQAKNHRKLEMQIISKLDSLENIIMMKGTPSISTHSVQR